MSSANVSSAFLAKLFGITVRRVQQLAQEKTIPKAEAGQYPLLPCVSAYVKSLQDALRHGGGENGDIARARARYEIARARARYEIARAQEKELEVTKQLGDVVLAEDVREMWDTAATNWRAKVLAIPSKVAVQTASLSDRHEIEDIVTALVEASLRELALYGDTVPHPKQTKVAPTHGRHKPKAKAAAQADSEPVGG